MKIRKQKNVLSFLSQPEIKTPLLENIDLRDQIFIDKFGDDPEIKILLEMASMAEKKAKENQKQTYRDFNIRCQNSYFIFSKSNKIRKFFKWICLDNETFFDKVILTFIILGSIKLGIDTYIHQLQEENQDWASFAHTISQFIDLFLTWLFFGEFLIKSITYGFVFDSNSYIRDNWCKIDFIIVCVSMLDLSLATQELGALKILRLLRTFRPLRFISHNPNLKVVVNAILGSLVGLMNVLIVILLLWIMFSILGVFLFIDKLGYCYINEETTKNLQYYHINKASVTFSKTLFDIYFQCIE